jgi:hypothetical protein
MSTVIVCPHCDRKISLRVVRARTRLSNWHLVDWSKTSTQIAKDRGVSVSTASAMRRKHAPHTIRCPKPKMEKTPTPSRWAGVDWTQRDSAIAAALGVSRQSVHRQRNIRS